MTPVAGCFIAAFAVTEVVSCTLESRDEAHAITFSEMPFVAALLLAAPADAPRRRGWSAESSCWLCSAAVLHKLAFNLALFAAEVGTAVLVLDSIGGTRSPVESGWWPGVFAALLAAQLLDFAAVTVGDHDLQRATVR